MNRQAFFESIRRGGEKLRADGVTIVTGNGSFSGKGVLGISENRFVIEVTLDEPGNGPSMQMGIHSRSEFWEIRGAIDDDVKFVAHGLPSCSSSYFGENTRKSLTFSCDSIDLEPHGFDRLTYDEISGLLQGLNKEPLPTITVQPAPPQNPSGAPGEVKDTDAADDDDPVATWFTAVLRDFKLIAHNGGTQTVEKNDFLGESRRSSADTYYGELGGWRFGLIQRDADLHVHFHSKLGHQAEAPEREEQSFRALLNALAFTQGQHAWPFSLEHRRSGRLVLDRIHLHGRVARTPHAPFSERLDFNHRVNGLPWAFSEALEKAYLFFSTDTPLSREVTQLLYLLREASKSGVPKGITLLAICSLFESMIHVIYEELVLPETATEATAFDAAKQQTCDWLRKTAVGSAEALAYERLLAILSNAAPVNLRAKFSAVLQRLELKPHEKWQGIFDSWSSWRNPLSHRITGGDDSEESTKEALLAESRIAGAINCFILKIAGYSGYVRSSAYEDEYVQI